MKKNAISLVAALAVGSFLACTTIAKAQDTNTQRTGRRGASVEQRVDRLSTELNLTDEQKTKVTALFQDQAKQMRAMRQDTSLSREDRRAKMRTMREDTDKKMKTILTPDQEKKWQQMRKEMRSRRGQRGGGNSQGQ